MDSLVDDIDVNLSIDRDTFEGLIKSLLEEIKKTCINLLSSTTPAVKKIIEDTFGIPPSTSLNADEGVAKGYCLQSAAFSDKFLTKSFQIEEDVTKHVAECKERYDDYVKTAYFDAPNLGLRQEMLTQFVNFEAQMIEDYIAGQEAKYILEGELYKYRALVFEK